MGDVTTTSIVDKGQNISSQNVKSRDLQNVLLYPRFLTMVFLHMKVVILQLVKVNLGK